MNIDTIIIHSLFSMVISLAFSILFEVRGKNLIFTAINGGIGYFIYIIAAPSGSFFAPLLASMAIMLYSEIFARIRKAPATVFLAPALIPIVPGGSLYNSMLQALAGSPEEALNFFYTAFLETAAIALGIVLISSIVLAIFKIKGFYKKKKTF